MEFPILGDITVIAKTVGKFEIYNGQKHIRLDRFDWTPTIGSMKIYATGILPDPEMSKFNAKRL